VATPSSANGPINLKEAQRPRSSRVDPVRFRIHTTSPKSTRHESAHGEGRARLLRGFWCCGTARRGRNRPSSDGMPQGRLHRSTGGNSPCSVPPSTTAHGRAGQAWEGRRPGSRHACGPLVRVGPAGGRSGCFSGGGVPVRRR
jgi:hypothetical protein